MMKPGLKFIFLSILLLALCFHFGSLFFYALPFKKENKFTFFSRAYVYPFFHQNWNLFAPVPVDNYRLLVQYNNKGLHTTDLFNQLVAGHQTNQLAGNGPLVLAFSNSIHYFEKNTLLQESINGPITNDNNFKIIEHEVISYLRATENVSPVRVKIYLVVENVLSKKQRVYYN